MKHFGLIQIATALLVFSVFSGSVQAWSWDWLSLYPPEIEAFTSFDGASRRFMDAGDSVDSLDYQWDVGLDISQQGYILDPGIVRFKFDLRPYYLWSKYDSVNTTEKITGNNLSYMFRVDMLQGTPGPFWYSVDAARGTNINSGSLGSRYESEFENQSATVYWKNPAFPTHLSFQDRSLFQKVLQTRNNVSSAYIRRDERVKTVTLKGHSSKTTLFAEHLVLDDRVPGRDLDYELDRINLGHNLPWGSNSNLRSRFDYYDRKGFNANRRINLIESATIQHARNISSFSNYSLTSISQNYETIAHDASFNTSHMLYNNLATRGYLWGSSQTSDPQDVKRWRGGLSTQYTKNFFGAAFTAGLGYSYQVTDRDTREDIIEVINEPNTVPLNGAVVLNRRFVITSTIIVTSADGSVVYTEGIDYVVFDLPEDLTQVQAIPGEQIAVGDTILVSYQAIALPSQEYSTTNTNYNLGLNLGWLRFKHSYTDMDEKLISGQGDSFLNPRRDVRTKLEFRWDISRFEVLLSADRNYTRYDTYEATAFTYREQVNWATSGNTRWNLSAVQSITESTTLNTDMYSVELSVDWQPRYNLLIRPKLGMWRRYDEGEALSTGKRDDEFITAGVWLRWFYRKVTFNMNYVHNQRMTDTYRADAVPSETNEDLIFFNLIRKF
jgi:hypothetical protein